MIELPPHPLSGGLALLALCGDLVVAIDATAIRQIRRVAETSSRMVDRLTVLDVDGGLVPGWDLGDLLGIAAPPNAWVIVDLARPRRRVGFRVGRCVMVQALPVCRGLPRGIFTSRPHAVTAAFSTAAIPELSEYVSGVVIDLSTVLGDRELAAIARLGKGGRETALEA